jgi:hypothetical protein
MTTVPLVESSSGKQVNLASSSAFARARSYDCGAEISTSAVLPALFSLTGYTTVLESLSPLDSCDSVTF